MDTTIRKLDPAAYRALKARAALAGRSIGDLVNDAIRAYLARRDAEAYRLAPPTPDEFGADEDALAWEGEDWEEFYAPR